MTEKEIRIMIHSEMFGVKASLFSDEPCFDAEDNGDPDNGERENGLGGKDLPEDVEILDVNTIGKLCDDGDRVMITYEESEETGMEGTTTTITFLRSQPSVLSIIRDGAVSSTLVFEEGYRHHCIYNTPFFPIDLCILTKAMRNRIFEDSSLYLDYILELRGAKTERNRFSLQILP